MTLAMHVFGIILLLGGRMLIKRTSPPPWNAPELRCGMLLAQCIKWSLLLRLSIIPWQEMRLDFKLAKVCSWLSLWFSERERERGKNWFPISCGHSECMSASILIVWNGIASFTLTGRPWFCILVLQNTANQIRLAFRNNHICLAPYAYCRADLWLNSGEGYGGQR